MWVALREQKIAGVGYYKAQSFMHIDTGRPRFWEPQTSRVGERISAGNARVFARTDYDRYRDLVGATIRLHSVTAFPLRISSVAHSGATALTIAPADDEPTIEDKCIVFATPGRAHRLRVIGIDSPPALKQRAPIVLATCDPRIEATPATFETNAVEVIP